MADLTVKKAEESSPNYEVGLKEEGCVGVLKTRNGESYKIPHEIVADIVPEILNSLAARPAGMINYVPGSKPPRDKTDNIGLIKPRVNEIRPSANDIALFDWNRNMDVIDAYIGDILETIGHIESGDTYKPIPESVVTTGIATLDFCQRLLANEDILVNVLYTGEVSLTDGPAGQNNPVDITIRRINNYVILQADSEATEPYEWFYHYADGHALNAWVSYGSGGGSVESYNQLKDKPSINGVTLQGDLSTSDIGIVTAQEMDDYKGEVDNTLSTFEEKLEDKVGVDFNDVNESLTFTI